MKKAIVVTLLALALVVLLSPGIIGRLAEQSVDASFDWASDDSREISVTSTGFKRGWFTSAGQHRVELHEGEFYYLLLGTFGGMGVDALPVLLIDTRLDHGLIPLTSMQRENGSLLPGLGSAVSTLRLEFADGSVAPLPGTLYSTVGLTGELQTRLKLLAGSRPAVDGQVDWGDAEFLLTSDARSGSLGVRGHLQSLTVTDEFETLVVDRIDVDLALAASGYGFMTGPVLLTLNSYALAGSAETMSAGPFYLQADSSVVNGRLDADLTLRIDKLPMPAGVLLVDDGISGDGAVDIVVRIEDVDAAALGHFKRSVDASSDADIEGSLMRLLAAGLSVHFDQFDIAGPPGQITSRFSATLAGSDADKFSWAAALLGLDASADISLPVALVDMATQSNPELHAAIGMGFLQKKGDYYVLQAAYKKGLLNVNGAPMPIPLGDLQ